MKRFLSMKLFLALQEASQMGADIDAQVQENGYEEFVIPVFSKADGDLKFKTAFLLAVEA
jgi:hypothetical protein